MKTSTTLCAAAAALGFSLQAFGGYFAGSTDFEGDSPLADSLWSAVGDASVETDSSVSSAVRPSNRPSTFANATTKVLAVDNSDPIVRAIDTTSVSIGDGIFTEVLVKGTPLDATAYAPEAATGDKLLLYTRKSADGSATNLYVKAAADEAGGTAEDFKLNATVGDEWTRLVIVAKADGAFELYCGGYGTSYRCATESDKNTFYALISSSDTISSVGFKGTGKVDDLIVSTFTPDLPVSTLTWDTSLASVSYVVDNTTNALTVADGSYQFQPSSGTAVTLIGDTGYRTVSATGTASASPLTLEVKPTGLAKYFPVDGTSGTQDGTADHPYEIPNYTALMALQAAVANEASARSLSYVQTDDIDFTGKPAFEGIGTYAKIPTSGKPFTGTYNGRNHKITNVTRAGGDTQGIFNQVGVGGVIENLAVSNMVFDASVTDEYGFAIVGNAGGGATLRNLTAEGVFGTAAMPGTHNMAGIVVRLSPGATAGVATTIASCTNNATIYGAYTKLGGINAIVQNQTGFVNGKVVFVNCANNGTLVCKRTAAQCAELDDNNNPKVVTGQAGIVGYATGTNVELTGCYGNGAITNEDGANTDKDGALVGWTNGGTIKDNGGNSAPADKKMIGTWGGATETGFLYATVDNDIATTIAGNPVAGGEYLLEGAAAPVIALDDGDTVAFDTALGYTLDDTGITAAEGLRITSETVGTVTTYTTGPSIYLDPASLELYPNCSNYVHVVGAPAGSTYTYKFAGQVGADSYLSNPPGWSKTEGWAWPYGKQPGGTGTITVTVSNNNAQVAQFVANVTVKDVAAVVDGVEYASADFTNALAAAKSGDKVLEMYYLMSSYGKIALAEGESIRWKPADNRGKGSFWTSAVTIPATTDAAWYKAVASKDNETGVTTITCVNQGVPYVKIDDGTTVTYSTESFTSMSKAGATYTLLRDMTNQTGGAVSKTGVILDLNGKKLGLATGIKVTAVNTAASLTIRDTSAAGTGEISGGNNDSPLVWALAGDTVTIESGTFVSAGSTAVYTSDGGTATISGGTFSATTASGLLNCSDSNKGTITVTGGSFQGFDPANNAADGAGTDYVATGYVSVADDPSSGWYTVYEAVTVTFVNEKGTVPPAQTIGKGKTADVPAAPAAEGFTFNGWFADGAATAFDFTTPVTANVTLTASWTAIASDDPAVDVGGGLAEYNAAHGTNVQPIVIDSNGFTVNFVAPAAGTYKLMTATSVDGEFTPDAATAKTVEKGDLVNLVDKNTTAPAKFYQIGFDK